MEIVKLGDFYEPYGYQSEVHNWKKIWKVLKWGRGTGKGRCSLWEGVSKYFTWVNEEIPDSVIPRLHFGTLAPTYQAAFQPWAEMKEFLLRVDRAIIEKGGNGIIEKILNDEKTIYLRGGCTWELQSSDRIESILGRGYDWLWVTEAPYHEDSMWYNAVVPMLRRVHRHGEAIIEGRPLGPDSYFEKLFELGQNDHPEVASSQRTTFENPDMDKSKLEYDLENLPEDVFRQEYMAETVADEGATFRNIGNCVSGELEEPKDGYTYVMGVDLGKQRDFTVLTIMHPGRRRVVGWRREGKTDWTTQKEIIQAEQAKWNDARIMLDSHGVGDPILDDLRKAKLKVTPIKLSSLQAKADLINKLRVAIENETVHFPPISQLVRELKIYRRTSMGRTGKALEMDRFAAPSGFHDDCVISLALAFSGCAGGDTTEPIKPRLYAPLPV